MRLPRENRCSPFQIGLRNPLVAVWVGRSTGGRRDDKQITGRRWSRTAYAGREAAAATAPAPKLTFCHMLGET